MVLRVPGRDDLTWTAYDPWWEEDSVNVAGLLEDEHGGVARLGIVTATIVPQLDVLASHIAWSEGGVLVRPTQITTHLVIPVTPLTADILLDALARAAAHDLLPETHRVVTLPRRAHGPCPDHSIPR